MEMLPRVEANYGSPLRSDVPYPSHPYLGRDPVLPVDPQAASTKPISQPITTEHPRPEHFFQQTARNVTDTKTTHDLLSLHQKQQSSPQEDNSSTLVQAPARSTSGSPPNNSTPNAADAVTGQPGNSGVTAADTKTTDAPTESTEQEQSAEVRKSSTPLSTDSLSDSEVPAKDLPLTSPTGADSDRKSGDALAAQYEQYKQAGYYKEYLKRYLENASSEAKAGVEQQGQSETAVNTENTCDLQKQFGSDIVVEPAELESAVKECVDAVIRQHNLRTVQSTTTTATATAHDNSSHPSEDNSPPKQDISQPLEPSLPPVQTPIRYDGNASLSKQSSSEFTSPQLSPFTNPNRYPPDFHRADSDPLSPRAAAAAAHIRQLQFGQDTSPIKRDFGPFGPAFAHPGFPLPNPFHHQLNQQINDLHIQRSRANTVPATDLLSRPRSDSFSSLPEGRRKREGTEYYYCHLCSYVGTTDYHFQAHMNSHFEHQCPHCDYKSRTEGRLKRHIKDFHTEDNPPDFTGGRIMRREPGKPKVFRCRQCDFVAEEKEAYWQHTRIHIKDDKCLQCPKCPFVTEYKHHLEYHLRNHFGSKPFKCTKCNYSCVNKSMLNSHMKSHTNVYQYRCADCTYATKYCHSLKLHLQKYSHKPAMVLNADGSLPTEGLGDFDLISKRGPPRGPRSVKRDSNSPTEMDPLASLLPTMHPGAMAAPGSHPLNGLQAMLPAFWPNGVAPPPPLMPVTSMPSMSMSHRLHPHNLSPISASESHTQPPRPSLPAPPARGALKCSLCDVTAENPHMLFDHTIRAHGTDNADLLNMFNVHRHNILGGPKLPDDVMRSRDEALMRIARDAAAGNATLKHEHPDSTLERFDASRRQSDAGERFERDAERQYTPTSSPRPRSLEDFDTRRQSPVYNGAHGEPSMRVNKMSRSPDKFFAIDSPPTSASSVLRMTAMDSASSTSKSFGAERPLDLTSVKTEKTSLKREYSAVNAPSQSDAKPQAGDEQPPPSAASATSEGASVDSGGSNSRPASPIPRKRSRKGNPFKLDAISMKLQTQYPANQDSTSDVTDPMSDVAAGTSSSDHIHSNNEARATTANFHSNNIHNSDTDRRDEPMRSLSRSEIDYFCDSKRMHNDSNNHERHTNDDDSMTSQHFDEPDSSAVDSSSQLFSSRVDRRKVLEEMNSQDAAAHAPSLSPRNGRMLLGGDLNASQSQSGDENSNHSHGAHSFRSEGDEQSKDAERFPKYFCQHCGIAFQDCIMYTIHNGYHGYQDPFTCNMCGTKTPNRMEFFLHIAREAHS